MHQLSTYQISWIHPQLPKRRTRTSTMRQHSAGPVVSWKFFQSRAQSEPCMMRLVWAVSTVDGPRFVLSSSELPYPAQDERTANSDIRRLLRIIHPFLSFPFLPFPSLPFPSLPFPSLPSFLSYLRERKTLSFRQKCRSQTLGHVSPPQSEDGKARSRSHISICSSQASDHEVRFASNPCVT